MSGLVESSADARSKTIGQNFRCRAWVNFDGTGTVPIRDSGNVSSISDGGSGNYTVNFTTDMPDTNYAVFVTFEPSVSNGGSDSYVSSGGSSISAVNARHYEVGTARDSSFVSVIVVR